MFVRKKPNKNGSISVQIIDKSSGKYVLYRTVGSSKIKQDIDAFFIAGKQEITELSKQSELPFNQKLENDFVQTFLDHIDSFSLVGPELLLGKIFDEIGFIKIPDELFRHFVITRLVYPVSKLKTVDSELLT